MQCVTSKPIVEYLVVLQRGGGVVGDLDAGREPVEDAVAAQHGVALRRDQHAGLRVAEDVVLLKHTLATSHNFSGDSHHRDEYARDEGETQRGTRPTQCQQK